MCIVCTRIGSSCVHTGKRTAVTARIVAPFWCEVEFSSGVLVTRKVTRKLAGNKPRGVNTFNLC